MSERTSARAAPAATPVAVPAVLSAALLAACLCAAPADAQQTQLAPAPTRISDDVIQRDHVAYETMQGRIKALNDAGRPVRDYALSKAQCWLDVSFHEYTRNDRSAFPQAAFTESERLIVAMEARRDPIDMTTALVNGATRLRPDLWGQADAIKGSAGFRCAQQQVACAEVELVHAGNEYNQQQWRHAKPYVQIAEDLLGEARSRADRCDPPAPPPPPFVPVAVTPPAPVPVPAPGEVHVVSTVVFFRFDRSAQADITPASRAQLDALLADLASDVSSVQSVRLVGHADRLNGTGHGDYNQRLSERRVETVRALFVARGVAAAAIETAARGDANPVAGCPGRPPKDALEACLAPDRRVDIEVRVAR